MGGGQESRQAAWRQDRKWEARGSEGKGFPVSPCYRTCFSVFLGPTAELSGQSGLPATLDKSYQSPYIPMTFDTY